MHEQPHSLPAIPKFKTITERKAALGKIGRDEEIMQA
jgi:hypothetical protein